MSKKIVYEFSINFAKDCFLKYRINFSSLASALETPGVKKCFAIKNQQTCPEAYQQGECTCLITLVFIYILYLLDVIINCFVNHGSTVANQ